MGIVDLLTQIRPNWFTRVTRSLARGESIRENLTLQLDQFYDRLCQAAEMGDPAWLDPILADWVQARTETELNAQETSLFPIISKLFIITIELINESAGESDALSGISDLMPIYSYAVEVVAQKEIQLRIEHISSELEKANQALQKLEKSKSDFIAVAAHELKTPLTLIEGYAAMLREQMPMDFRQAMGEIYLQGIYSGSKRLKEIVDDMVDVSMIDNNLLSINYQPVWLNHILEVIQHETASTIQNRSLQFKIIPFPGLNDMTFGDGERLLQAIRNVITNSIKFTPDGGSIVIDGRRLPGFIEMTVADSGIGIAPENHLRIFEKFGRLGQVSQHSSGKTKFKGGGPGLGLPIAKGIVEAHGGTIWVESEGYDEVNCPGSTFHILIPLIETPPDIKTAKLFQSIQEKPSIREASGENIME